MLPLRIFKFQATEPVAEASRQNTILYAVNVEFDFDGPIAAFIRAVRREIWEERSIDETSLSFDTGEKFLRMEKSYDIYLIYVMVIYS